ncbi:MAG TPA: inositol monophosphatase family protein [Gemmatimonadales bacterium]|nr:inositol monophosphatase family protein [Gemmatimonadales bacterium]
MFPLIVRWRKRALASRPTARRRGRTLAGPPEGGAVPMVPLRAAGGLVPSKVADWVPWLTELADSADRIALDFFQHSGLRVDTKPDASPVTEADRAIEATLRAAAGARYPNLGILGEEQGAAGSPELRLIIDPIDGTRNFVRGIPVFATLLAIESAGEVVAGLVSAPALRARWWAARGAGAFRDGRRLAVSGVGALEQALLLHGNLAPGEGGPPAGIGALLRQVERTRGFGDFYQHMLVAEGAAELAIDPAMHPWDIAALQVVVEEAGGRATAFSGARSIYASSFLSSNGLLHDAALRALGLPEEDVA